MTPEKIASLAHEVNKAYCEAIGDTSQVTWDAAPIWQKESAIEGIRHHLENPGTSPEDSHKKWLEHKRKMGWKYGPVKDTNKMEHPCMVPYASLPASQKVKDHLFAGVVAACVRYLGN